MNAFTPCAADGCEKSPAVDKIALYRVNPKGEAGIFMCSECAREVNRPPSEPRSVRSASSLEGTEK